MTVNPGSGTGVDGSTDSPPLSQDTIARLARAYMATYRARTVMHPVPTLRSPRPFSRLWRA